MLLPENLPKQIVEQIEIAIKMKKTWTIFMEYPLSDELQEMLLKNNIRVVYSRSNPNKYKIYIPYSFRAKGNK